MPTNLGSRIFRFDDDGIVIAAPGSRGGGWAQSEEIRLYDEQPTSKGDPLTIAVERISAGSTKSGRGDEADA